MSIEWNNPLTLPPDLLRRCTEVVDRNPSFEIKPISLEIRESVFSIIWLHSEQLKFDVTHAEYSWHSKNLNTVVKTIRNNLNNIRIIVTINDTWNFTVNIYQQVTRNNAKKLLHVFGCNDNISYSPWSPNWWPGEPAHLPKVWSWQKWWGDGLWLEAA